MHWKWPLLFLGFGFTQAILPFFRGTELFPLFSKKEIEESETKTDSGKTPGL